MSTLPRGAFVMAWLLATSAPAAASAGDQTPTPPVTVQQPPESERWRTEAQVSVEQEGLSNGYGTWRTVSLEITQKGSQRRAWYAGVRDTTRFSLHDRALVGGFYHPLSKRTTGMVEAELSPSHLVVPRWALAGWAEASLGRGWVVNAGVRHRRYDAATVNLLNIGAERYVGAYRLVYTAYVGHLVGAGASGSHLARADRLYGRDQGNFVGVSVSAGSELEHIGSSGLLRTSVLATSLSGRHWVTPRWAVVYNAGVHEQGTLYMRTGGTASLRYRF